MEALGKGEGPAGRVCNYLGSLGEEHYIYLAVLYVCVYLHCILVCVPWRPPGRSLGFLGVLGALRRALGRGGGGSGYSIAQVNQREPACGEAC